MGRNRFYQRWAGAARRAPRALAGRIRRQAVILVYHRIADVAVDPWHLAVTPRHFAEHLDVLRRVARPIGLSQLTDALRAGRLARRSVVLTFDDGYVDNLLHAKPLLARADVPASVFVVSGQVGRVEPFWWDELERVVLRAERLPATLSVTRVGAPQEWLVDAPARDTPRLGRESPSAPRQPLFLDLWTYLKQLPAAERAAGLRELRQQVGPPALPDDWPRTLNSAELRELAQPGPIDIGAHTVSHPTLANLSPAEQWSEVSESKRQLEDLLERPVTAFAYPFGRRADYTAETARLVRAAGFSCACSNFSGGVTRATDRFELPRVQVGDWDGDTFARRLAPWLRSG